MSDSIPRVGPYLDRLDQRGRGIVGRRQPTIFSPACLTFSMSPASSHSTCAQVLLTMYSPIFVSTVCLRAGRQAMPALLPDHVIGDQVTEIVADHGSVRALVVVTGHPWHPQRAHTAGHRQRGRDRHAGRQQSTNSNGASADQGAGPSSASDSGGSAVQERRVASAAQAASTSSAGSPNPSGSSTLTVQFSTPGPLVAAAPTASSSQVHGHHAFSLAAGRRRARTPSRRWCCAGSRWCRLRARSRGSRAPCARAAARA